MANFIIYLFYYDHIMNIYVTAFLKYYQYQQNKFKINQHLFELFLSAAVLQGQRSFQPKILLSLMTKPFQQPTRRTPPITHSLSY